MEKIPIKCYRIYQNSPEIVPGKKKRIWMDETTESYAYRCLPLNIANYYGWDILCPADYTITWDGTDAPSGITIIKTSDDEVPECPSSHFGFGVLSFHLGYLFKTTKKYNTLFTGAFNESKNGIAPLSGIVETSWLNFTVLMNWRFTEATTIEFKKGEPICRIIPVEATMLENFEPEVIDLGDSPKEVNSEYKQWNESRSEFHKLAQAKGLSGADSWQKNYYRGENPWESGEVTREHKTNLKLMSPILKTS